MEKYIQVWSKPGKVSEIGYQYVPFFEGHPTYPVTSVWREVAGWKLVEGEDGVPCLVMNNWNFKWVLWQMQLLLEKKEMKAYDKAQMDKDYEEILATDPF